MPERTRRAHVVLVHRYFHPDTPPYASILREIALCLGPQGTRVTVLTCQPSYNRKVVDRAPRRESLAPGVQVRRFPVIDDRRSSAAKVLNLVWFLIRIAGELPRLGRVDRVMAASTPPVILASAVSRLARLIGADFVYHHQDIYPEVVRAEGRGPSRLMTALARGIDGATDRRAARVVVLSRDMAEVIASRGVAPGRLAVINNFDPWEVSAPTEDSLSSPREGPLRVVYAGNLGTFQNLDSLLGAIEALAHDDRVIFDIIGSGVREQEFVQLVKDLNLKNVKLHGYQEPKWVAEFLRSQADLGLVTLNPGVIRAAYPSKTLSYLRNGVPVLAMVEGNTELVEKLTEYGAGWSAEPTARTGLTEVLCRLAETPQGVRSRRVSAARMYSEEFDERVLLERWRDVLAPAADYA